MYSSLVWKLHGPFFSPSVNSAETNVVKFQSLLHKGRTVNVTAADFPNWSVLQPFNIDNWTEVSRSDDIVLKMATTNFPDALCYRTDRMQYAQTHRGQCFHHSSSAAWSVLASCPNLAKA